MSTQFLPLLLMVAVFGVLLYFSSRSKKRQQLAQKTMRDSIQPGTRVSTTSGLQGTVTAIADDTIELEIAPGVRTTWVRAAVREVIVPATETVDAVDASDIPGDDVITTDKRSGELG